VRRYRGLRRRASPQHGAVGRFRHGHRARERLADLLVVVGEAALHCTRSPGEQTLHWQPPAERHDPCSLLSGISQRVLAGRTLVILFADDDRLYIRGGWARAANPWSWVKIHDHTTLRLATAEDTGSLMVKRIGQQAWPIGEVDRWVTYSDIRAAPQVASCNDAHRAVRH
jgi:hypothetical protein